MKKWIFILLALSLSLLSIATTTANTAQQPQGKQSSSVSKRTEAALDDQVFEIILPKNEPSSLDLSSQQISHQTQISLLQQVSPLIGIALSCLLIVITVSLFHWRETKKSSLNKACKQ